MAVQVIPNPTLGVGVWITWGAYLLVVLFLVLRQFAGQWGLSFPSSSSRRPQRAFSTQTLLDYFTNDEFVGPTKLACILISPIILAPILVSTPNDIYTNGFSALGWLPAILFGVLGYMLVAARLSKLSTIRAYSSPIDFLNDRYRSRTMRAVSGLVMVLSSVMFMAILMKTAGSFISVLSGESVSALAGAIGVGAAILCFELLGGLSSVGLIDIMHVAIMLFSFFLMYILQSALFGGFAEVLKTIRTTNSMIADSPAAESHLAWILWTIPFIAFPLYPHLMPRLQGHHSSKGLRFALVILSLAPFLVLPAMLAFGFSGRSLLPNLPLFNTTAQQTSADIFALTIRLVMTQGSGYYFLGCLFFIGSMSVIMSTTSCSISGVSAVIALDLYRPLVGSGSSVHVGRMISVVSTVFLLSFAVVLSESRLLSPSSLIGMINGVLLQLMPAFLLGLYSHFQHPVSLNIGMMCGIVASVACHLAFTVAHDALPADLGALIGLVVNTSIVYVMSLFLSINDEKPEEESKKEKSISDGFSLGLSREASVEAPMQHKASFGKFKTVMPSGLVGWRMVSTLDISMELHDLSVSEGSSYSSSNFAVDHARIGSTTLGSIGRIGDGNTEPIHNPVLLGASAIFLILSSPFYFSTTSAGISTNGIPFWIYLSFLSALMASATLIYVMFSSWDVKSISSDSSGEPSFEMQSISTHVENSIEPVTLQNEPSTTMESVPVSQLGITRFASKGLNPFGRFSRAVANDSDTQKSQQNSSEFNFGKSDRQDRQEKHKFSLFGKRSLNPGSAKPEKNDRPMSSTDFGSELGSFSLEEEIRQYRYR